MRTISRSLLPLIGAAALVGLIALVDVALSGPARGAGQCLRYEVCDVTTIGTFSAGAGVAQDSGGIKHLRGTVGCATAASVGSTCDTTITWTTPFADASYTINCQGIGVTSGVPAEGAVITRTATAVSFRTIAETAAAAQFTTIECMALHDGK